jgi:hypothetical protein
MMQQAIFIEPDGELRQFLIDWKQVVTDAKGNQPYVSHPPHATLLVSRITRQSAWRAAIEQTLHAMPPLELRILRPFAFFDDPGTGGGQTLALEVDTTAPLMTLQKAVADASLPFVDRPGLPPPTGFQEKEPFRSSFMKWGYPFVGPHWRPHFSVASLLTTREDPLIARFLAGPAAFRIRVSALSLWDIDQDTHARLGTVPFGRTQS